MLIKITAVINKQKSWYVARCLEIGVVSQGKTIEEAKENLQEAVEFYLESFGEDDMPENMGDLMLCSMETPAHA